MLIDRPEWRKAKASTNVEAGCVAIRGDHAMVGDTKSGLTFAVNVKPLVRAAQRLVMSR